MHEGINKHHHLHMQSTSFDHYIFGLFDMAEVSKVNGEMGAENKIEQNCTIEHKQKRQMVK